VVGLGDKFAEFCEEFCIPDVIAIDGFTCMVFDTLAAELGVTGFTVVVDASACGTNVVGAIWDVESLTVFVLAVGHFTMSKRVVAL
jgi:hypothetical protein